MESGREAKRCRIELTTEQEVESGCIMESRCPKQHAATACLSFLAMPPQHRRALATRRGLCLVCLTYDRQRKCDQTRCDTDLAPKPKELWMQEHWLMSQQCGPKSSTSPPAHLPLYGHVAGRQVYQCRMPLTLLADGSMSKTAMETLFDDKAQRTVIRRRTAIDRSLPSIRVSPTLVEVPGFEDEVCDRLYFIDAFTKSKKSDVSISAWGVTAVAKDSAGAPEPELLRIRLGRPTKQAKKAFAQPPGTIELLMGQDYARWFPKVCRDSTQRRDDLYFLRTGLMPTGIVYGEAAVGLVVERRRSGKKSGRESRESSGASACREPGEDEQGQRGQTVEKNMLDLFGAVSTSEESSCSDKPYSMTPPT
jgi:hypothetical protein